MNMLGLFHTHTIEEITGIGTNVSVEMRNRIELWNQMMSGDAPWNRKAPSCGILGQISGRLSTLVMREIGVETDNKAIEGVIRHLNANADRIVSFMALLGGCLVRPIFSDGRLQYEMIPLGNYLPTRYDFDGTLTGALILKNIEHGRKRWLLTEEHTFENGIHSVKCTLYRNDDGILKRTSLSDCPQTQNVTEGYAWQNVREPMIVEFRNHDINRIDGSDVPTAIIAGAEELIKEADEQFARMNWEQIAGEKKIFADRDMFQRRQKRNGVETADITTLRPELNKLIVQIEGDGSADGKKITEFSPSLRTAEQNEMFQQILRRIELTCNIGKGTLSDMESQIQTATQYSGGRQELYAVVDRIEDELEAKYKKCAKVFAHMAAAYGIGANDGEIRIKWSDDQTRKDITQAKQMALQEISSGVKNKWEYRREFFGESEADARANVPEEPAAPDPFNFGA